MAEAPEPGDLGSSQSRIARLFKNTGIYALGEVGLTLLSALLAPILTLFLTPAEFGLWSLALMLYTGFMHLCNPALHGAVTRFFFDHEHDGEAKRRFQGTILSFLLIWTLGVCVLATIFGDVLFAAIAVAQRLGVDAELALRETAVRFRRRLEHASELARADGRRFEDADLDDQLEWYLTARLLEQASSGESPTPGRSGDI